MKFTFNSSSPSRERTDGRTRLTDLKEGARAILDEVGIGGSFRDRLHGLGFVPGTSVEVGRAAAGGRTRIYHVDGAAVAMRWDVAEQVTVLPAETC